LREHCARKKGSRSPYRRGSQHRNRPADRPPTGSRTVQPRSRPTADNTARPSGQALPLQAWARLETPDRALGSGNRLLRAPPRRGVAGRSAPCCAAIHGHVPSRAEPLFDKRRTYQGRVAAASRAIGETGGRGCLARSRPGASELLWRTSDWRARTPSRTRTPDRHTSHNNRRQTVEAACGLLSRRRASTR